METPVLPLNSLKTSAKTGIGSFVHRASWKSRTLCLSNKEKQPELHNEQHLSMEDSGRCWKRWLTCSWWVQNSSWGTGLPTTLKCSEGHIIRRWLGSHQRNPSSEGLLALTFQSQSTPSPEGQRRPFGTAVPGGGEKLEREQLGFLKRPEAERDEVMASAPAHQTVCLGTGKGEALI